MPETTIALAPISSYTLGPAHALLALDAPRRAQAVHLLEGLRASWGAHEAFCMSRLLRQLNPADYPVVIQALHDLLMSDNLLMAVTPIPPGEEGIA
jgi:hypothetical protein